MFKKKYTAWMPFGNYNWVGSDYIIYTRKHLKNGICQFKTVRVHKLNGTGYARQVCPNGMINTAEAWARISGFTPKNINWPNINY